MIGFLFVSTSYIYGTLLTANNNLKHLNILAGITVAVNVSLNLFLIPRYHAVGAAISSLVSQAFYAVTQLILAGRILKVPVNGDILIRKSQPVCHGSRCRTAASGCQCVSGAAFPNFDCNI